MKTGAIDYVALRKTALEEKPKILLAWFSAYPRELDYDKFAEIAQEVGAIAMADMSHIGGLIAWWVVKNPLQHGFQVMMTTTHKSLRWPRGALILSNWTVSNPLKKPEPTIANIPTRIDRAVFPWVQWGPHMNTISAVGVALHEASQPWFQEYARQIVKNAQAMADEFITLWYDLVTWWTDNHMLIMDFQHTDYDGSVAEKTLDHLWISTSKSTIPNDPRPPFRPSGLRIGTPAMTTRGLQEAQVRQVARWIDTALKNQDDKNVLDGLREEVKSMALEYAVPVVL
jgi:glycine hydroxymethyltransferase